MLRLAWRRSKVDFVVQCLAWRVIVNTAYLIFGEREMLKVRYAAFILSCGVAAAYGHHEIVRSVIASGGGTAQSDHHSTRASIGQPLAQPVDESGVPSAHMIRPGFWQAVIPLCSAHDVESFVECIGGPSPSDPFSSECACVDFDEDDDVDLRDFAVMQRLLAP
jgi:hypothetical protein